ncbi:ionotropic receptor 75a-like [Uranotaenia lowii]|uniref:ionotropic receptor 75a-like n=1 Tax=Uranotaenia lowii TaxID=190385 RepID=UPI00247ADEE3|nr:ionotropic receptor 75a-like [Uranotaenia lowii]
MVLHEASVTSQELRHAEDHISMSPINPKPDVRDQAMGPPAAFRAVPLLMLPIINMDHNDFHHNHRQAMSTEHYRFSLVVDLECSGARPFLEFMSTFAYFNESYHWLLFGRVDLKPVVCSLETKNINVDTRITLATSDPSKRDTFELSEVYGSVYRRGGRLQVRQVGWWNTEVGAQWTGQTFSYRKRKDFRGIELLVITTTLQAKHVTLLEYMENTEEPKGYINSRYGYKISRLLSFHHNFKIKFLITKGWSFGAVGTNSTSGVIGQTQANLVDFSATPVGFTPERVYAFASTTEIVMGKFVTVFRHPAIGSARNFFLRPFQNWLWIAVLVVLLMAGVILLGAFGTEKRTSIMEKCQLVLAITAFMCQQGYAYGSTVCSSRIVILTVLVFAVFLYQFYSTFIIGYLLLPPQKTIKTLKQLLDSSLKFSVEDRDYNHQFFSATTDNVAIELYQQKVIPNEFGFVNMSTGMQLAKHGGTAFHCDVSYGYTWIKHTFSDSQICELQEVTLFPYRPLHLILPRNSPLRDTFRITLQRLLETGVAQYHRRKYYMEKPRCTTNSNSASEVTFNDIESLYRMLAMGIVLGLSR